MKFKKQVMVDLGCVKSSIAKESFGIDEGMLLKEVYKDRDQGFGICQGFVFIRGIGFLFHDDIRMRQKKVFIIEGNVSDNSQSVGDYAEFKGIAEMPIDVHLLDGRV